MREGIAVGGSILVDILKTLSAFPRREELVKIEDMDRSLGGAVSNVAADLARLDPTLPLWAVGRIGRDSEGEYIRRTLSQYPRLDLSNLIEEDRTSFTDVLVDKETKKRTFMVYPGASAHLDVEDFDLDRLTCRILHVGYILLLDTLDGPDGEYGTRMARLRHDAQERGILTSVDVVSEVGDRYRRLVTPSLRFTDYFIVNELEAGKTCGTELRDENGRLIRENIPMALAALKEMGVKRWAVIHAPEGGWGLDEENRLIERPSLKLGEGFIQGTVGAGDAFCAGVLLSAYRGCGLAQAIDDGCAAAACSLRRPGASEGVGTLEEARALAKELGTRDE